MRRLAGPTRAAAALLAVAVASAACRGPADPAPGPAVRSTPAPALPASADGPRLRDCHPGVAKARGVPRRVPVPSTVLLQGPDRYAAPYEAVGRPRRRIAGSGFAFEIAESARIVSGFYSACLERYGPPGWRRIRAEGRRTIFRIPVQRAQPSVVVVAGQADGPTAVVVFLDYSVTATGA